MESLGLDLDELIEHEEEPGLGNGGLGRLAACFLDSLATLEIPAIGYGIRYEFGIFDQEIRDGWQVESDRQAGCALGNPWEIRRPRSRYDVGFGGRTEDVRGRRAAATACAGSRRASCSGVAYDTPIARLRHGNDEHPAPVDAPRPPRSSTSTRSTSATTGGAVEEKVRSENITKVLYPNDGAPAGKQLRLEQQYFFVSCALQDMHPHPPADSTTIDDVRRQVRDPAQRHAPGARGRRS